MGEKGSVLNRTVREGLSTEMLFEWTQKENGGGGPEEQQSRHPDFKAGACLARYGNGQEAGVADAE